MMMNDDDGDDNNDSFDDNRDASSTDEMSNLTLLPFITRDKNGE